MSRRTLVIGTALCSYAVFAGLLIARLRGWRGIPVPALLAAATLALVATLVLLSALLRSIRHGPLGDAFDASRAVACSGEDAEAIRRAASRRGERGGSGYVRRWGTLAPAGALAGVCGVLASGLLNLALSVEGRWIQFAASGRDLDLRDTYSELSLGVFADPRNLRYGVQVRNVRPSEPARLADVEVIDASGKVVGSGTLGPGKFLRIRDLGLFEWSQGPGVNVTVVQEQRGKLFHGAVPLRATEREGEFEEFVGGDDVGVTLRASGWPGTEAKPPQIAAVMRHGEKVLFDGSIPPRQVVPADEGYGVIVWEVRPYVGLGVTHRTFRDLTLASLAVSALGLLAWPLVRARPFWYREAADGSVLVHPASASAALREARR